VTSGVAREEGGLPEPPSSTNRPKDHGGPGSFLGLAGRLERVARHLDRDRSRALALEGLTPRDIEILNALRRAGSPYRLSQGDLARAAQLTSGGMTGQADRMEQAGWVERNPDPHDRRGVLLTLTEAGQRVLKRSLKTYVQGANRTIGGLDAGEQETLGALLSKVLASIENEDVAPVPTNEPLRRRRSRPPPAPSSGDGPPR
jgi:DNA-binding MarR family transcriptional regulator